MKILIVCENYYPHYGGAEVLFKNLAEGFVKEGHRVAIVTTLLPGTKRFEEINGVKTIRNKVSRQDMAKVVGASREMVSRVMKDLEERGVIETQENGSVIIKDKAPQPE